MPILSFRNVCEGSSPAQAALCLLDLLKMSEMSAHISGGDGNRKQFQPKISAVGEWIQGLGEGRRKNVLPAHEERSGEFHAEGDSSAGLKG